MESKLRCMVKKIGHIFAPLTLIVILGFALSLLNVDLPVIGALGEGPLQPAQVEGNIQTVSIDVQPKKYAPIMVQRGIPVHFVLNADQSVLNSCNSTVVIPEYGIEQVLKPGKNIIDFTPGKSGTFRYTCKMGMVKSKIKVVDKIA